MPGNFHAVPEWIVDQWPEPNYANPIRRAWMPVFALIFPAISTVLILGRFWLRATRTVGSFGLDDLFIGIGWLFSVGFSTIATVATARYDLDRHTWDVDTSHYVGAAASGWAAQVMFLISTCATKTSVLLFYRRMVAGTYSKGWMVAVWVALGFLGCYFISILFAYCFICTPLTAYWESYDFNYHENFTCLDGNFLSPFVGALSVFTDVYAVLLPCIMLAKVNLDVPRKQKIGLNIIFGLGLIVAGFGIARCYYLWEINNTYDTSWAGFDLYIWSLLECHFAIIFACAPSLRVFVRKYLGDTIKRTFGSSQSYSRDLDRSFGGDGPVATKVSSAADSAKAPRIPSNSYRKRQPSRSIDARASTDEGQDQLDCFSHANSTPSSSFGNQYLRSLKEVEAFDMDQLQWHAYDRSANNYVPSRYDGGNSF